MESGARRRSHASPRDGQAQLPSKVARLSSDREENGHCNPSVPSTVVPGPSEAPDPDDQFCNSVVQKILPALVRALGKGPVGQMPADSSDSDVSSDNDDIHSVNNPNVSQDVSQTPHSGLCTHTPYIPPKCHHRLMLGFPPVQERIFLGFLVTTDQHVAIGRSLGAAFDFDEADGALVTETFAKKIRVYLRMIPDDKKSQTVS
ncbi:hypothetical protein E2C01_089489 [Portunus trituberculatus]|uniref:Uncharacterized protein n=1 Tax=Portunus trituberculatus TaxID=210409 RepID=A0A5B7JIC5_PORTR|nr:hypothetical protein [Portunus trituberculatus]